MAKTKNLVIVESPAKIKTISKFLGKDYTITASFGHVRDLPSKSLGVDVKTNFEPKYTNMKDKAKVIKTIKQLSGQAETVLIATDPDREGEAIAWHIANAIKLPQEKLKRIVFNEITKKAVHEAINNSREIDMKLVDAQQARRILDRLIGYKLSPVLSRKIRKGLSAGRVQSVAVKIICDREKEIDNFVSEEYWNIDVTFNQHENKFQARLFAKDDPKKKLEITDESTAKEYEEFLKKAAYTVEALKETEVKRNPYAPFITSTLQQEASRKLSWSAKKTMMIAQQLYEEGHITYMRTDSTRISDEAKTVAKSHILKHYGEKYYRDFTPKPTKKNIQDAHEAIRPAYIDKKPKDIESSVGTDHYKLYKLIWARFMASQMSPSISKRTQVTISAKENKKSCFLRTTGSVIIFDGFTILYTEDTDQKANKDKEEHQTGILPPLSKGETLKEEKVDAQQKFTQPPPRYTEASLVKVMEEQGIGRPSTYAPTLSTIVDRGYVEKEGRTLHPSDLGKLVTEKLEAFFNKIIDLHFTAEMETQLDEIMEGKHTWQDIIKEFYDPFSKLVDNAYTNMEKVNTDKPTDEICDKCKSPMVIKAGRFGEFLACTNFPDCKNTKSIVADLGVNCPDCSNPLVEKRSKRGKIFYGCSGFPDCKYASWDKPINEPCPNCKNPFTLHKNFRKQEKTYCPKCDWEKDKDKDTETDKES